MLASVRVLLCVRGVCQAAAERGSGVRVVGRLPVGRLPVGRSGA